MAPSPQDRRRERWWLGSYAGTVTPLRHTLPVDRIAVIGPVASGKTTFAARLGSILGLPVIDLDDHYWRQSPLPTDGEWVAKHSELISGERWIISGDYRAVAEPRFQAADTVVWLDLPRLKCLYWVTLRKAKGHPAPLRDSWRWIWRYANHGKRDTAIALAGAQLNCSIYRFRSAADVTSFLGQVESELGAPYDAAGSDLPTQLRAMWRVPVDGFLGLYLRAVATCQARAPAGFHVRSITVGSMDSTSHPSEKAARISS